MAASGERRQRHCRRPGVPRRPPFGRGTRAERTQAPPRLGPLSPKAVNSRREPPTFDSGESGSPKLPAALKQARQTGSDVKTLCSKKKTHGLTREEPTGHKNTHSHKSTLLSPKYKSDFVRPTRLSHESNPCQRRPTSLGRSEVGGGLCNDPPTNTPGSGQAQVVTPAFHAGRNLDNKKARCQR